MIPNNEQSTIVLFAKVAAEMGYMFKEMGTRCPDAILEKDGKLVRVEFEYKAKTFQAHKHNPDDVDLIICWEDDWPQSPLPVLSLEKYVTLAEIRPERPTVEVKPSLWQRLIQWQIHRRQLAIEKRNLCSICGHPIDIQCSEVRWPEDIDSCDPYQWLTRRCPNCKREEMEFLHV